MELSEQERLAVDARFPSSLKGRVLRAVHFRVHPKLEGLCDIIYERFEDRFFEQERVFIDIGGQRYFGTIGRIFPPPQMAQLAQQRAAAAGHHPDAILPPNPWGNSTAYGAVAHAIGTDLDIHADEADQMDRQDQYVYLVQLMDDTGQFGGSALEVAGRQLSRDRQCFSKSMLKRYLRQTCGRVGDISVPWRVDPRLCVEFGLPTVVTHDIVLRNGRLLAGQVPRRKLVTNRAHTPAYYASMPQPQPQQQHAPSRPEPVAFRDPNTRSAVPLKREAPPDVRTEPAPAPKIAKRHQRYPMEDLELDPLTILDGRHGSKEGTTLPVKPKLDTDLGIEDANMELLLSVWSFLSNFGDSLLLSAFTLDDFISALQHTDSETPCPLIAEVHAVMINVLIAEGIRLPGAASVSTLVPLPQLAAQREGFDDGMTSEERTRFIRRALLHARKWDRSARLKAKKGRKGWQRYMLGALCQRGGLEVMPTLPRIIKHLFNGEDVLSEDEGEEGSDDDAENGEAAEQDDAASDASVDEGSPAEQYFTLPLSDKLAILSFFCDLCMGCRKIKYYVDATQEFLLELRKHRTELNRTKRELDGWKTALDKSEGQVPAKKGAKQLLEPPNAMNGDRSHSPTPSIGDEKSAVSSDRHESEVESNAGPAEAAPEAGPSSAPLLNGGKKGKGKASPAKKQPPATREALEAAFEEYEIQLDEHERDCRRCKEAVRTMPLGYDRFHNAYIWLDGVGCQDLIGTNGTYTYGTGRLFVQAPQTNEWEWLAAQHGGSAALRTRQRKEEGAESGLEPGQWAAISMEEQLDQLIVWLNGKGVRESKLKDALTQWRGYIIGGMAKRAKDLKDPFIKVAPALGDRRSARINRDITPDLAPISTLPTLVPRYLMWKNQLA